MPSFSSNGTTFTIVVSGKKESLTALEKLSPAMVSILRATSKMASPRDQSASLSYHPILTILAQSTRIRETVVENLPTKSMSMRDNGSVTYLMALATKSSQMETNSTVNSCWERSKGRASISGSRDNFKYTEGISATTK